MDDITLFGETNFRNERRRFGIKTNDRRRHMYVIGKTGMGKTTLLENMAIQDMRAGKGVGIVDPHGEFAEKMLDFIPEERIKDVIYFNPADLQHPVAFNSMESVLPEQRHLVASGLLGVFKKIWPDVWSPRMEYLLSNAILALLETPGSTLLGINRMFADKEFRKSIVSKLDDPVVKAFWEKEYAQYQERFATEASAAIQNKVGQFISNPLIRNIVGQEKSSMDMREMMDNGKIFIVNLSKGRIGEENARLLGAMLVTKLYLTATTRVDMPEEERRDFYLYVDEFQNFATESFASILSEARKYRLNLILAHQYITQMDETVQDAVFGNVGTLVTFRIGAQDAELMEKEFGPEFMSPDLVNLAFAQVYLRLMIDGVASRPFSASTLPPASRGERSYREEIIAFSRSHYSVDAEKIRQKIAEFHGVHEEKQLAVSVAREERQETRPPQRKLYDAICAVDGEAIQVPFMPDGRRPVYCEKHLEMLKRGELPEPPRRIPQRPDFKNNMPFRQQPPVREAQRTDSESEGLGVSSLSRSRMVSRPVVRALPSEKPLSLEMLRSKEKEEEKVPTAKGGPASRHHEQETRRRENRGEKKEINIGELRKVLGDSLDRHQRTDAGPSIRQEKKIENDRGDPRPVRGTIEPGETIHFD